MSVTLIEYKYRFDHPQTCIRPLCLLWNVHLFQAASEKPKSVEDKRREPTGKKKTMRHEKWNGELMGKLIFDSNRRVDSTKGEEADVGVMFGNKDTSGMSVILGEVMNGHVVLFGQKQPQVEQKKKGRKYGNQKDIIHKANLKDEKWRKVRLTLRGCHLRRNRRRNRKGVNEREEGAFPVAAEDIVGIVWVP
ncbi:hypothetical protein RUM43_012310 [Polyplax serrata]|uniref:Uncharacterized protein n=1 Tax=Polyplax serrata TaxID=468196 RepID=A0AAN8PTL9_POLSC